MKSVRFRYVGSEPREVSMLPDGGPRLLEPGVLFEVPGEVWGSYACQPALYDAQDDDPGRESQDDVLARVGDDQAAATVALAEERTRPKPRPKLMQELERRAALADEPAPAGQEG